MLMTALLMTALLVMTVVVMSGGGDDGVCNCLQW